MAVTHRTQANTDPTRPLPLIASLFLTSIGGLFLFAGILFGANSLALLRNGLQATGTVVGVREDTVIHRETKKKTKSHTGRISFTDANGGSQTFSGGGKMAEGTQLPVLYLPEDPTQARINSFGQLWGGMIALGIAGVIITIAGLFVTRIVLRKREEINKLKSSGLRLQAKVLRIEQQIVTQKSNQGRTSKSTFYQVVAQCREPNSGRELMFCSYSLPKHPGEKIVGTEIPVFVDPKNFGSYYLAIK